MEQKKEFKINFHYDTEVKDDLDFLMGYYGEKAYTKMVKRLAKNDIKRIKMQF
jgi:hypothetical protein